MVQPDLAVTMYGEFQNVPLSAYVLEAPGERTVDAIMTISEIDGMVSMWRRSS